MPSSVRFVATVRRVPAGLAVLVFKSWINAPRGLKLSVNAASLLFRIRAAIEADDFVSPIVVADCGTIRKFRLAA